MSGFYVWEVQKRKKVSNWGLTILVSNYILGTLQINSSVKCANILSCLLKNSTWKRYKISMNHCHICQVYRRLLGRLKIQFQCAYLHWSLGHIHTSTQSSYLRNSSQASAHGKTDLFFVPLLLFVPPNLAKASKLHYFKKKNFYSLYFYFISVLVCYCPTLSQFLKRLVFDR